MGKFRWHQSSLDSTELPGDRLQGPGCKLCNDTSYASWTRQQTCRQCPSGQYQGGLQYVDCPVCPVGKWTKLLKGATVCDTIATNAPTLYPTAVPTAAPTSATPAPTPLACPPGKFGQVDTDHDVSACGWCPYGKYTADYSEQHCTNCTEGYYTVWEGATECTLCEAGQYATGRAHECKDCAVDTYGRNGVCKDCPFGKFTHGLPGADTCTHKVVLTVAPTAAPTKAPTEYPTAVPTANPTDYPTANPTQAPTDEHSRDPECIPGYFGPRGGCKPCAVGKYSITFGAPICITCEAGKFTIPFGATTCNACETGKYSPVHNSTCLTCANGRYADWTGATSCGHCPSGQYQNETTYDACVDCAAGRWTEGKIGYSGCYATYAPTPLPPTDSPTAYPTAVPTKSPTETPTAYPTHPNDLINNTGSPTPIATEAPTTSFPTDHPTAAPSKAPTAAPTTAAPTKAPTGTIDITVAPTESSANFKCKADTYYWGFYLGEHYCVDCPDGTFSPGCDNCHGADCQHSELVGQCVKDPKATTCRSLTDQCPKGKYIDKNAVTSKCKHCSYCTTCPTGKWQQKPNRDKCEDCPAGRYMDKPGMYGCYNCPVGKFQAMAASTSCSKCDQCTIGNKGVTDAINSVAATECKCEVCPRGTYTHAGYITCFKCPAGRAKNELGAEFCDMCPMGKYAAAGSTECTSCPDGETTVSWMGGKDLNDCQTGTNTTDFKCPAGRFINLNVADLKHSISCVSCPAGKFGATDPDYKYGGKCNSCETGQFSGQVSALTCEACPTGWTTIGQGDSKCGIHVLPNCSAGQHILEQAADTSICVDCSEGKFGTTPAGLNCVTCAQGYFQSSTGKTSCSQCDAEWTSNSDNTGCKKECATCPAAPTCSADCATCNVTPDTCQSCGTATCTLHLCPAGTRTTNKVLTDGNQAAKQVCEKCRAGRYSMLSPISKFNFCLRCPTGKWTQPGAGGIASCSAENAPTQSPTQNPTRTPTSKPTPLTTASPTASPTWSAESYLKRFSVAPTPAPSPLPCITCPAQPESAYTCPAKCASCVIHETSCHKCKRAECIAWFGQPPSQQPTPSPTPMATPSPTPSGWVCEATDLWKHATPPANVRSTYTDDADMATGLTAMDKYCKEQCNTATRSFCHASVCHCGDTAAPTQYPTPPPTLEEWKVKTGLVTTPSPTPFGDTDAGCGSGRGFHESDSQCAACSRGQYKDSHGNYTCNYCPAGKYTGTRGSRSCWSCPAGKVSSNLRTTCDTAPIVPELICPLGKFITADEKVTQQSSITRQYADEEEARLQFRIGGRPQPGSTLAQAAVTRYEKTQGYCSKCPAGKYGVAEDGTGQKENHQVVWHQVGQGRCVVCPTGKYQDTPGLGMCKTCAADTFPALDTGAVDCVSTDSCTVGTYHVVDDVDYCFHCPAGKFGDTLAGGVHVCTKCAAGQFQAEMGQTTCTECAAGQYSTPHGTGCYIAPTCQNGMTFQTCIPSAVQTCSKPSPVSPVDEQCVNKCACPPSAPFWNGVTCRAESECGCSHVKCHWDHDHVVVFHHNHEKRPFYHDVVHHVCAYNHETQVCKCECSQYQGQETFTHEDKGTRALDHGGVVLKYRL